MKSLRILSPRALLLFGLVATSREAHASLLYNFTFDSGELTTWANTGTLGGTGTAAESAYNIAPAPAGDKSKAYSGSWSGSFTPATAGNPSYAGALLLPDSTTRFRMDSSSARMTISTWINWAGAVGTNNRYGIVNTLNSSQTTGWSFYIESDGKVSYNFAQASSGKARARVTTEPVIPVGKWTHVAFTWDASVGNGSAVQVYVNGLPQPMTGASLVDAVAVAGSDPATGPLDIALGSVSHPPGAGGSFSLNGNLDDFAMWDTVLSGSEIRALNTASMMFPSCTASVMDRLFNAYKGEGSCKLGSLVWSRAVGFGISGHSVGDMWRDTDGRLYLWLEGSGATASGLMGVPAEGR